MVVVALRQTLLLEEVATVVSVVAVVVVDVEAMHVSWQQRQ